MGTAPEPGRRSGPARPQDLHIGQAGVVIDGGMQVVVAASTPVDATVDGASGPAADTVAATCRDAAELLGVQVDQVAWPWVLVAADRPPGGAVQPGQPVTAMTDQDPVDGRGREVQPGGDASWAETLTPAQPEDALFDPGRGRPRAAGGDAGPVDQSSLAELLVAGPPAVGGGPGDAHLVGDVGDRPPGSDADPLDQGQSSGWGQPGVSVRHEASSERGAGTARTSLGGLTSRQQPLWAEQLDARGCPGQPLGQPLSVAPCLTFAISAQPAQTGARPCE